MRLLHRDLPDLTCCSATSFDSPRGRIYLIKDMLENGKPANAEVVTHLDRCLSCLSCMTTCPSGVHYQHLIDHARAHVEETYDRPWHDRLMREILARVLPYPGRFRLALAGAFFGKPLRPLLERLPVVGPRLGAMLSLAPSTLPPRTSARGWRRLHADDRTPEARGAADGLRPARARSRDQRRHDPLLTRLGVEVVLPRGEGCCGALVHHMGREHEGHTFAKANIDAWTTEIEGQGLDAIIITRRMRHVRIKDYGPHAARGRRLCRKGRARLGAGEGHHRIPGEPRPAAGRAEGVTVAYHSACSMSSRWAEDHGRAEEPAAPHGLHGEGRAGGAYLLGSAGVYNILQPESPGSSGRAKVRNIERTKPDLIAAGNIGCMTQIGKGTGIPIVHTVQLIDWATAGRLRRPSPAAHKPPATN